MKFKTKNKEWRRRFAIFPQCVYVESETSTYVWLEWYEKRWNGVGKYEAREIGSDVGYRWEKFVY